MKFMKTMKVAVAALGMAFATAAGAAVVPGTIGTDFSGGLAYAEAHGRPIAVVWGNTECTYCKKLHAVLDGVKGWLAEHPIVFVSKHEDPESPSADYLAAKDWLYALGKSRSFPLVGLYWKKPDGSTVKVLFSGRDGKMPVTTPKGDLAGQFVGTLDEYFGEYTGGVTPVPVPVPAGDWTTASFKMTGGTYDRLEAEPSTSSMYVPLVRGGDAAKKAGRVTLAVCLPNSSKVASSLDVAWKAGETVKSVRIDVPAGKKGQTATVRVLADGDVLDTDRIRYVAAQANSVVNPHFVGESFDYGEWTMDYDAAKSKGGVTLALFSGTLWCPYCYGLETSLLASTKFRSWAKKNRVNLVLFDQGEASSPATPAATSYCRLLTYDGAVDHIDGSYRSGASYLSRRGIDPASSEVKRVIDRVTELTSGWRTPDVRALGSAVRLGNPTILLVRDDKVVGRFNGLRYADKSYDINENVNRLNELLKLAEHDEKGDFMTTTTLSLAPGGSEAVDFQINSRQKFYRLSGFNASAAKFRAVPEKGKPAVRISLMKDPTNAVASAVGTLIVDLRRTPITKAMSLMVETYADAGTEKYGSKSTAFSVVLTAEQGDEEMMRTVPLAELTKAEAVAANANLYAAKTYTVPLRHVSADRAVMAGVLTVKQTSKNRLTAAYQGSEAKSISFKGEWEELNLMTGEATVTLLSGQTRLVLALGAGGTLEARIPLVTDLGNALVGTGSAPMKPAEAARFAGPYTVTLPDVSGGAGTAVLTLNAGRTGRVSWSGYLPNGAKVSGTAPLVADADGTTRLGLLKRTSKDFFTAELAIRPDAAASWGAEGQMDAVSAAGGVRALHSGQAAGETLFEVYGGPWRKNASPLEICQLFGLGETLAVTVGGEAVGEVTATKGGFKCAKGGAVSSLSLSKSTGLFNGKATVGGVKGMVRGTLLPGWIDCHCGDPVVERPYGSGTFYYSATENGKKVTRSIPLDLNASPVE